MAGLGASGFVGKPLATILAEVEAAQRAALGDDLDVSAETPLGQINGIFAAAVRELWELAELIYAARDPRRAGGDALDAVSAISGTTRRAATYSTVTLSVTLAAGQTLAAGAVAHVNGQPTNRWVTTAAAANSGGSPATVDVAARAEDPGPQRANAGTITVIATPTSGWSLVTNAEDAEPGEEDESDPALRARREDEVAGQGTAQVDAIRRALREVDGVTEVVVWENLSDYTDAAGRPPHSVEALVVGGDDDEIAAGLFAAVAGGIRTHGSESGDVVDETGATRTLRFSRPTEVEAYARLTVTADPALYAGDTALKAAVAAVTDGQDIGAPLRLSDVILAARAVEGVTDVVVELRRYSVWTSANLTASNREVLALDTSRVTVVLA